MDTSYDGAGNVVQEFGPRSYAWDPLGMMTSATVGGRTFRYLYDASNERIAAVERVPVGTELRNRTTFTLRGADNQLLSTWTDDRTSGTRVFARKEDTIWRGSQVLALATPFTEMNYALDHLGSTRTPEVIGGTPCAEEIPEELGVRNAGITTPGTYKSLEALGGRDCYKVQSNG
jgi:hypothetical protein